VTKEQRVALAMLRDGFHHGSCPDSWSDCNAARTLADAFAAEHPEDDDLPLTREWLIESGFKANTFNDDGDFGYAHHSECSVEVHQFGRDFDVKVYDGHAWKKNPTRGQLRRLVAALKGE